MSTMRTFSASSLVVAALVTAAPARADKTQQATQLWQTHCANCHVVGRGQARGQAQKGVPHGYVDLTLTARAHDDAWLQRWILAPHAIKPDTRCFTAGLELRQIDLLVAFLRTHARPPVKHSVAAAQSQPPRPPDPKPQPQKGLVRGR